MDGHYASTILEIFPQASDLSEDWVNGKFTVTVAVLTGEEEKIPLSDILKLAKALKLATNQLKLTVESDAPANWRERENISYRRKIILKAREVIFPAVLE
ncbi:MAG: hypothetical protein V1738_00400 [Patescibacteria group bacterium]